MTNSPQNACFDSRPASNTRQRLTESAVIGRKLKTMYEVPTDCCDVMTNLMREIDRKLGL